MIGPRRGAVLIAVLVFLSSVHVPAASAAWAASTNPTTVQTTGLVVPAGAPVAITRQGLLGVVAPTFTISWTPVPAPYGTGTATVPVTWYVERFTGANTTADATASTCNRVIVSAPSCVETISLVNLSQYRYRVTPVLNGWIGTSAVSAFA